MAYRFATCNEVFKDQPFPDVCVQVREAGYGGLEVAPFTLAADPATLTQDERSGLRKCITSSGLSFVGLHWLLAAPAGLHATARDEDTRKRAWKYVDHFIDLCADLASSPINDNGVVVFGSPKQRSSRDGFSAREATEAFVEGLSKIAPHAEERGVTLLVEALAPDQTDVVTSLAEAVEIVRQIGSPAIQTMFDTHNAVMEVEPHTDLVRRFFPYIKHVHVNEMDGKEPGAGDYDFASLLKCLSSLEYTGWVSLEALDFERDPRVIINGALNHLRNSSPELTAG